MDFSIDGVPHMLERLWTDEEWLWHLSHFFAVVVFFLYSQSVMMITHMANWNDKELEHPLSLVKLIMIIGLFLSANTPVLAISPSS